MKMSNVSRGFIELLLVTIEPGCRYSPDEEALGESGNEGDFDEQANNGFGGCQRCKRIVQGDVRSRRETTSVERGDAEHDGVMRRERRVHIRADQVVCDGESTNHKDVSEETAKRAVAIASDQIEKQRTEVAQVTVLTT